jgi:hypothetical protein
MSSVSHSSGVIFSGNNAGPYGGPGGRTFYVNSNIGLARNIGRPWYDVDGDLVFDNLQDAIDACVDSRGDVIYVARAGYETSATINFNKTGISVIGQTFGITPMARGEYCSFYAAATLVDVPVAIITAPCLIQGLGFISRDSRATFYDGAAVLIGGAAAGAFGVHMKWCRFPKWGLDNSIGLSLAGGAAISNVLIEECEFEGAFSTGIYVQGAVGHLTIRKCTFALCTYAITHGDFAGGSTNTQMIYGPGNITVSPTRGIDTNSKAVLGTVCGNYWGTGITVTHDLTVDNTELLGLKCVGNYYGDEERDDD